MACGTPVIASNASSLPEMVGEAEIIVEPHDVRALVEAMKGVLMDEEKQREMREKELRQAARFFWERAARETMGVYRKHIGYSDQRQSQGLQYGLAILPRRRNVAADLAKDLSTLLRTETAGHLLLHFDHADASLPLASTSFRDA